MTVVMILVTEEPGTNAMMHRPTLVPAFPAALTLTAPVALVTATPGIQVMQIPDVLRWIPVSAAETALARDKHQAALLLRYRPLLVKTALVQCTILAALKLVLNKAKKTATVHASALPNAAVDARVVTPVKMEAVKKTTLTATAVPADTLLQLVHLITSKAGQQLKYALAAQLREPAINVKIPVTATAVRLMPVVHLRAENLNAPAVPVITLNLQAVYAPVGLILLISAVTVALLS